MGDGGAMTDLTIEKLENMLGAHSDHVYRLSARGEDFAYGLAAQLLATMQREGKLRQFLLEEIEFGKANKKDCGKYNEVYFSAIEDMDKRLNLMLDEPSEYRDTDE